MIILPPKGKGEAHILTRRDRGQPVFIKKIRIPAETVIAQQQAVSHSCSDRFKAFPGALVIDDPPVRKIIHEEGPVIGFSLDKRDRQISLQ